MDKKSGKSNKPKEFEEIPEFEYSQTKNVIPIIPIIKKKSKVKRKEKDNIIDVVEDKHWVNKHDKTVYENIRETGFENDRQHYIYEDPIKNK
jgi:uncharacterized protein (UPF0335 family)